MSRVLISGVFLIVMALSACARKSKSDDARVRAAYFAGQQAALERMQPQGLSVRVVGPVTNPVIQWTEDLTLAKAIVASGYRGAEPGEIIIIRSGQTTRVHPQDLLRGQDLPLEIGDVVQIQP